MKWRPWSVTCDVCGFEFDADEVKTRWDGAIVCAKDFEYRHELDLIRPGRTEKPVPFTRPNRDGEISVEPIYYDQHFFLVASESEDVGTFEQSGGPVAVLNSTEEGDTPDFNVNFLTSFAVTETADTLAANVDGPKELALSATEASDTTNNSFAMKQNFTLESITDGGSFEPSEEYDGVPLTVTAALSPKLNGQWGGIRENGGTWTVTLGYFGSPNTTNSAQGIYWRWIPVGASPTYNNMIPYTWYPVGNDTYYVGSTITGSTPSSTTCVVGIQFAYDASGTGATTAGTWTLTAEIKDDA